MASIARADFGLSELEVSFTDREGAPETEAGAHPFAATTRFSVNTTLSPLKGVEVVDGALRNLEIFFPTGFAGNPTATLRCETIDFLVRNSTGHPSCADSTAIGTLTVKVGQEGEIGEETVAMYNMRPPAGSAARIGVEVAEVPTVIDVGLTQDKPYRVVARLSNTSQIVEVLESTAEVWGNPADPIHDPQRGNCAYPNVSPAENCESGVPPRPFLTLPRSCTGTLTTLFEATSWWSGDPLDPGPPASFSATAASPGLDECSGMSFSPELSVQATTERADAASGLEANLRVTDEGIDDPEGRAHSDIREAIVTLPKGMTVNPSQAEGLETCSEADLADETPTSAFGSGCPAASKVGTVEATTPLLEGVTVRGQVFVATPFDNLADDSLIAIYMVLKHPELGVVIKQTGKVTPDPRTGQLTTVFSDLPQLPLGEVRMRLREGGRSPLVTPPSCGTHEVKATFIPWAASAGAHESISSFQIDAGPRGEGCPSGALPFLPGFSAGTLSNQAGSHSPYLMRLTRRDGDQDLTRFDATLPRGLVAKLAGIPWCPDAAIAAATSRDGKDELASPSCPEASRIGSVQAGAGVGSQLTYVPGSVYLAGPFGAAPLSVVAIVPAVAGPFDVGTVVARQALVIDPVTAEVRVDGALSDPIPHILAGILLRVRDIQVSVDRPAFALNPTSCAQKQTVASIWGGGQDPFSRADDFPAILAARFQAAGCAALGFQPRLSLRLKGGTKRGAHPALRAVYRPRAKDANLRRLALTFPRSEFIENANFRTICTRVQFAANTCPAGSVYGRATAFTPLLDEPLRGPVYLRSSDNPLPDVVVALKGIVDAEVAAKIDSVKGRLRATIQEAPDVPVSKVIVEMQGAGKGLFVNSQNICRKVHRATVKSIGHNGRKQTLRPVMQASCGGKAKKRSARR